MRNTNFTSLSLSSTAQSLAIASLGFMLLAGSADIAQAQGYENVPPPPLSVSSPTGNTAPRGVYVLPETRPVTSQARATTRSNQPLPGEELQAPLSMSSPTGRNAPRGEYILPGTRPTSGTVKRTTASTTTTTRKLPALPRTRETILAPVQLSGGLPSPRRLSTTGSINLPSRTVAAPTYPKPIPAPQATPEPLILPQTAPQVAETTNPTIPFGRPSRPISAEPQVVVTAPAPAPVAPTLPPARVTAPAITTPTPNEVVVVAPQRPVMPIPQPAPQSVEPLEPLPWEGEPVIASAAGEPALPTHDITPEFDAIVRDYGKTETLELKPQAPAETTVVLVPPVPPVQSMPLDAEIQTDADLTVQSVETPEVAVAEIPSLSEESRKIIEKTPSGIDTKVVIARTPKPVIIKRNDPSAGNISKIDVRTHEEMGMKIEIRRADKNVHAYLEQGYENLVNGREAIAAGYYTEALNADPKNELALFGLATTYQRMGQLDEARELYGKLLDINPTHREALNNFMALISHEAPQDAIAELEQLETENPDFSPIPAQLGIVYGKIGNSDMALKKLARALELSPDNISYKYNLASTLDSMGHNAEAAELYMELIEDYNNGATLPGDITTIRNRAIFLSSKG